MTAELFALTPSPSPTPLKAKTKPKDYTEEFDTKVWGPYPRKVNCSKFEAFKSWQRLSTEEQAIAILAIPIFARACNGKDEHYIPHCATWLNQKRYETIQIPAQPKITINIDWPTVLKIYAKTNNWNPAYGPAPDQVGYRGPKYPQG